MSLCVNEKIEIAVVEMRDSQVLDYKCEGGIRNEQACFVDFLFKLRVWHVSPDWNVVN